MSRRAAASEVKDKLPAKAVALGKDASSNARVCELCEVGHPSILTALNDEELAQRLKEVQLLMHPKSTEAALLAACAVMDRPPADPVCKILAEHAARFTLTHGAHWIHEGANLRAQKDRESKDVPITRMPSITLQQIRKHCQGKVGADLAPCIQKEITIELWPQYFCENLMDPKVDNKTFCALDALIKTSQENLERLRKEALFYDGAEEIRSALMKYPLTLTHYSKANLGYQKSDEKPKKSKAQQRKDVKHAKESKEPEVHATSCLTLWSRSLLDDYSRALGVEKYSKENTPDKALKDGGHYDYVFFSIEPRAVDSPIAAPFKATSRFGDYCHAIEFDSIPDFAIMTLGDLDTRNAKINFERIKQFDKATADRIENAKKEFPTKKTRVEGEEVVIQVREFRTMSEQLFIKEHIKEALALATFIAWQQVKIEPPKKKYAVEDPKDKGAKKNVPKDAEKKDEPPDDGCLNASNAAEMYNVLMNSLYVPQLMIPHAFGTNNACVFFKGGKPKE